MGCGESVRFGCGRDGVGVGDVAPVQTRPSNKGKGTWRTVDPTMLRPARLALVAVPGRKRKKLGIG